jgi:hypothetical protein
MFTLTQKERHIRFKKKMFSKLDYLEKYIVFNFGLFM